MCPSRSRPDCVSTAWGWAFEFFSRENKKKKPKQCRVVIFLMVGSRNVMGNHRDPAQVVQATKETCSSLADLSAGARC